MKLKNQLLLLIVYFFISVPTFGQIKVYNVESTIVKEFNMSGKTTFQLNTKKADVTVVESTSKMIKITAVLSSKNSDKQLAENDLKLQKNIINKKSSTISIVNYVEINSGASKPTSNLHISYTIEVPRSIISTFKIKNEFGKIEMSNIKEANTTIESKFCPVMIIDYEGSLKLDTYYGDVNLKNIKGDIALGIKHSKLEMENHFGDFTIKSSFSKINLINTNPETVSTITDDHSEINLSHSCLSCSYILFDLEKSELNLPDKISPDYTLKEEFKLVGSIFNSKTTRTIDIKSNTGMISLKTLLK